MPWLLAILTLLAAYLLGAVPFGYLLAWVRGVNIFEHGSGNIGATNVGRVLGYRFGIAAFVLDFAKGAIPVALALWLKPHFDEALWTEGYVEVAAGLCAFLGHIFPIYLRFHGGKGVAAGCGAVFVLMPIPTLIALGVWAVLLITSRLMSLASIVAVGVLCIAHLAEPAAWDWRNPRTGFCVIAGALVIWRHRVNMVRLIQGNENQLKDTPVMRQLIKSLHVLALGLWFGSAIFFTFVVALSLFNSFQAAALQEPREPWFPQPTLLLAKRGDEEALKEQGTRAAGHALAPLFVWYFALQGACGFIALATALALVPKPVLVPKLSLGTRTAAVHRWRVNFLIAALALVVIGWPLERKVHVLRGPRNQTMEAFLQDRGNAAKIEAKDAARAEFGQWHGYSIVVNLACILCVTAAMALAGNLNGSAKETKAPEEPKKDEHAEGIFVKKGD